MGNCGFQAWVCATMAVAILFVYCHICTNSLAVDPQPSGLLVCAPAAKRQLKLSAKGLL
jgi:hypothetical protein